MANPQLENGYTRIANELLDAMVSAGFSKREWTVLMAIVRKTYGFNKKEDAISGWQIAEMTGIDRSHVSKTIVELLSKNVILQSDSCRFSHGQEVKSLSINKHYSEWFTVAKTATETVAEIATVAETAPLPKQPRTVAKTATETVADLATPPLPKQPTQKTTPKDNTKDNSKRQFGGAKKTAPTDTKLQAACRDTWKAYSEAFNQRYQVLPIRNAAVNAQVRQFVSRIGFDESPQVAAFFVTSNEQFYVRKAHSVGVLLADAEKVRMQWATGRNEISAQIKTSGQIRNENIDLEAQKFLQGLSTGHVIEGECSRA